MNLAKLIELQAAATPGPWQARFLHRVFDSARNDPINLFGTEPEQDLFDCQFMAAARNFDFAALDEKILRYEDALRFYASGEHFRFGHYSVGFGDTFYTTERGERARKALEGTE